MEIERKWVVEVAPDGLSEWEAEGIEQGYLAITAEVEVRVRRRAGVATLTVKSAPALERVEEELAIAPDAFERLWALTAGRRVVKVRHVREVAPGVVLELDVYAGDLDGLIVLEVEFADATAARAWTPPPWVGRELTGDPAYANQALAAHGRPASP